MTRRLPEIADADREDPLYDYPDYRSTRLRSPKRPLLLLPGSLSETTGPVFGSDAVSELDADLTIGQPGEPIGQRIVVSGRLLDTAGTPIRGSLVEIWQANAGGRYRHDGDQHPSPLDPNFIGCGRTVTDGDGRYRFVTIRPGSYPWGNHHNAWRPAHIHFSVFGRAFTERLVTQMYFPGDPLFDADPIFQSVRDPKLRELMISTFDWDTTTPEIELGYRFDIVVGRTPEDPD
jgi:protocatechuate 3,4-dioxygenase beta subunit